MTGYQETCRKRTHSSHDYMFYGNMWNQITPYCFTMLYLEAGKVVLRSLQPSGHPQPGDGCKTPSPSERLQPLRVLLGRLEQTYSEGNKRYIQSQASVSAWCVFMNFCLLVQIINNALCVHMHVLMKLEQLKNNCSVSNLHDWVFMWITYKSPWTFAASFQMILEDSFLKQTNK